MLSKQTINTLRKKLDDNIKANYISKEHPQYIDGRVHAYAHVKILLDLAEEGRLK